MKGNPNLFNYRLFPYIDEQGNLKEKVPQSPVTIEKCYADTLSGFYNCKPNEAVLFSVICDDEVCGARLCEMYANSFNRCENDIMFVPEIILNSDPSFLPITDRDNLEDVFRQHKEGHSGVMIEQRFFRNSECAIGNFTEYCLSDIAHLRNVIWFQTILPLLCYYGIPGKNRAIYNQALAVLQIGGHGIRFFDLVWAACRELDTQFPQRVRFTLRVPGGLYEEIRTAIGKGNIPFVDRVIHVSKHRTSHEILSELLANLSYIREELIQGQGNEKDYEKLLIFRDMAKLYDSELIKIYYDKYDNQDLGRQRTY